jgi:hypothetical protein
MRVLLVVFDLAYIYEESNEVKIKNPVGLWIILSGAVVAFVCADCGLRKLAKLFFSSSLIHRLSFSVQYFAQSCCYGSSVHSVSCSFHGIMPERCRRLCGVLPPSHPFCSHARPHRTDQIQQELPSAS